MIHVFKIAYMRYLNMLLLFLAAVFCGCKGGYDDKKVKGEYKRTDSILKNTRNVDSLKMFVKTYHDSNDKRAEVIAMRELGKRLREESKFSDAIDTHRNGLKLAESIKDTNNIIQILNQLGTSYRRIGIMDEAAAYHYRALSYCDMYGNPEDKKILKSRVTTLNGIGNAMKVMGNDEAADSIFRQALEGEKKLNSPLGMAINYANLGTLFERKKQFDSAMVYYGESMRLNSEAKSKLGVSLCYTHFGQVYEKRKMIDSAIVQYNLAYDVIRGDRDLWHILASTLALARAYMYIVVLHVGQRRGDGCRFRGLKISFGAEHGKDDLLLGPVVVHCTFVGTDAYYGAVCFGKGCAGKRAHLAECRRVERGIDVGERAKRGIFLHLLSLVVEKEVQFFHFRLNEAVAPPSGKYRAGLDVPIVRAAPHQVVERELLCALCHNG